MSADLGGQSRLGPPSSLTWGVAILTTLLLVEQAAAQSLARPNAVAPALQAQDSRPLANGDEAPPLKVQRPTATRTGADSTPNFQLQNVSVEGASPIPAALLASAYRPYLGRSVSEADLVSITGAMTRKFKDAGFHLTRALIQPQAFEHGHLTITVVMGSIEVIDIQAQGKALLALRSLLAPLTREKPSTQRVFERQLMLARETPGLQIADVSLEELGSATGHFKLTIQASDVRARVGVSVDNSGSHAVGPWEANASAALNSLIIPGDVVSVVAATVPNTVHEFKFGRASYEAPISNLGLRGGFDVSHAEIWPGDSQAQTNTQSLVDNYNAHLSYVPLLTQSQSLWLTGTLGVSDNVDRNKLGEIYRDNFAVGSFSLDYRLHTSETASTYLSAQVRNGLGLIEASSNASAMLSRPGASPWFTILAGTLTQVWSFYPDWSVKVTAAGQYSGGPLLASQQFYLGGQSFGRGFGAGVLSGDKALAGSGELRHDLPLQSRWAKSFQVFGFVDGGVVASYLRPGSLQQGLASVGGGVRLNLERDTSLALTIAKPIAVKSPTPVGRGIAILVSASSVLSSTASPQR